MRRSSDDLSEGATRYRASVLVAHMLMEVSTLDIHEHQIQGSYFHGFHIRVPYGIRGLFLNILVHGVAGGRRLGDVPWGRSTYPSSRYQRCLRLLKITERDGIRTHNPFRGT